MDAQNNFYCKCVLDNVVKTLTIDDASLCTCALVFAGADGCTCEHEHRSSTLIVTLVLSLVVVYICMGILMILSVLFRRYSQV